MRVAIHSTQWHLYIGRENPALAESFSSLERVFKLTGPVVSRGAFCHVIKWRVGDREYYVKRYRPGRKHSRKALGRNRAEAEYRNYAYFARMGIPVPTVVAWGSQRRLGLLRRGAIITEEVPLAADLKTLSRTRPDLFQDRAWLVHVMRQLASHLRKLHADGFTHRDLKWRNVLVTAEESPRVFLLDCPNGRHTPLLLRRHFIVKDLGHLDRSARGFLSQTMRLRFYLWWRGQSRLTRKDKELIARISAFQTRHGRTSCPQPLNPLPGDCHAPACE